MEPKLDDAAVHKVFLKSLDNYIKWCDYLGIKPAWSNLERISGEKKLLFLSLYFLIWGEAANIRFLPECLCYIFHQMVVEMNEILRQQVARPAASCMPVDSHGPHGFDDCVSFLDNVIAPLYEVVSAEALHNENGRAPHSEWRNYDDFNEYFWSLRSFELGWPWRTSSSFFQKPIRRRKKDSVSNQREHIVLLLANEQSRLNIPEEMEPKLDDGAVHKVFLKSLDSYIKWCDYLCIKPAWSNLERISGEKKLLVLSLYFLIWGEAANIRFLPECLCYIFHHMVVEMNEILRQQVSRPAVSCMPVDSHGGSDVGVSFLDHVIAPLYEVVSAEAFHNENGRAPHSEWRNYDDFNEYFWSLRSFELSWPWRTSSSFFQKPIRRRKYEFEAGRDKHRGKTSFVEHRTFLRLYHSFHRLWIFLAIMFQTSLQALAIIAFNKNSIISTKTLRQILSLGPTYVLMKFSESLLDVIMMYGAYSTTRRLAVSRIFLRFIWFSLASVFICFLYVKMLQEDTKPIYNSVMFKVYGLVIAIYGGIQLFFSILMHIPSCRNIASKCDRWAVIRFVEGMRQERHYVGRDMYERMSDFIKYFLFWLVVLSAKFSFAYFLQIAPLVGPTRMIMKQDNIQYSWHEFVSIKNYNALTVASLWAPVVAIYLLDIHIFYTIASAFFGFLLGARDRLGEIRSLEAIHKQFEEFPGAFMKALHVPVTNRLDEWKNFLARIGQDENALEGDLHNERDILELRFWASYRGQTLARTVRGMMYYRKALMLQSYLERKAGRDGGESTLFGNNMTDAEGFELSPEARAQADLKFTYVVTCQIYGRQKEDKKPEAVDIALLMQRNEALRVAYIDVVDTPKEGISHTEYYSKLVKADINGKDKEIYSIRLPGDPKLGEGKPENQNHAIVFTRGNALQTIDMNQDNYFEEALKMRNLLEEFDPNRDHGIRPPTILGVREHVFTGSVSSLASFMSNQETSFVTLGQRVLAKPLKIRMHYGHPDVFDRVFHITRGGISKASRVINISEDIFAGFNSTLRQGNITHHEYIQVGKGRDVGLNQIALFEGKVASGNGEQVLSRDVYRLGQLLDFFRMLSFYFTTVGFYFSTMLTVLTLYIFLYGRAYLALSGVGATLRERAISLDDTALSAALNAQFLFQIGVFTAVPMILGFILEQGFLKAIVSFTTMQFQLCTVFFTFSLGTRTHYFGRTILHGGARYQATGRGFVVKHITFSENYRLYSRSHFVKGLEVILLLVVYLAYGNDKAGAVSYILLTVSSWFLAGSWLFAPFLFNPAGFEWQKVVVDFTEWTNWLFYRGGIGVKGSESWEAWWEEELIYGWSWAALAIIIFLFKVFTFSRKISVNFQLVLRLAQGIAFLVALAVVTVGVVLTDLSVTDIFASVLALIPTGWGILSIACAWKPIIKRIGMWKSIRSLARLYDAGMGMLIFLPVAFCSWFPFLSTFQTRMMFNQGFSRGLEISLILAGNHPNSDL
ncbi:hypothetical protein F2Q70_00009707 [Brassica cretica]|uniref:1,3-beta-glucan synthase n=1 Tax=Brassica cretica TaxID=69181 RepID=A0A8S9M342_BRACR|nr:hypothetical protein F2Q70_00009707 [Brassica cretica]